MKSVDLGFVFSRILAFYGFASVKVLREMPLLTFWMLHKNVDRIAAERDQRAVEVALAGNGGEFTKEKITELKGQMGLPFEFEQPKKATRLDLDRLHDLNSIGDLTNHAYPG